MLFPYQQSLFDGGYELNDLKHFTGWRWLIGMITAVCLFSLLVACGGGGEAPATTAPDTVDEAPATEVEVTEETAVEQEAAPEPTDSPAEEAAPTAEPVEESEAPAAEEAVAETPAIDLPSGDLIYSDGNQIRDAVIFKDALWTPSLGGLIRYDLSTGEARKFTTQDGLPNIGTFAAEVCPVNGTERLLIGTREGIVLYEAATDSWESGAAVGFTDDATIMEMVCDAENGRLLIDHDGLTIIDLATQDRTNFTEEDGLAWFTAEQMVPIGTDVWWMTDFGGMSRVAADGTVELFDMESGTLPDDNVSDIVLDANGVYWIAASDGLIQWENGTFTLYDRENTPEVIDFFGPSHVETAVDNTLWLGFNSDLCRFDPATSSCVERYDITTDLGLPEGADIGRMVSTAEDGLILQTFDEGAAYFDGAAWTLYALPEQTPGNFFDDLLQTSDGTIWVNGRGLFRTDLMAAEWNQLPDAFANDLVEAADGTLWLTGSRRVQQFTGSQLFTWEIEDGLLDTSYNAITIDDNGVVFVGGTDGYSMIDGETITAVGPDAGWDVGNIRDLHTVNGVVYAATVNGLVALEGDSWTVLLDDTFVNLPAPNIAALASLPDGTLLLGTIRGLATYQDGEVTAVPEAVISVADIETTADGQIHLVGFGIQGQPGGYRHFDGAGWNQRPETDFPMTSLRAVMVDTAGTVWIALGDTALGGGIFRIVP